MMDDGALCSDVVGGGTFVEGPRDAYFGGTSVLYEGETTTVIDAQTSSAATTISYTCIVINR